MPGTKAPECFGFKGREVIQLARTAGTFGADIMEVSELCPQFDASHISIKTAVLMICHFLGSRAKTLRDQGLKP
jgi:agmatinase